MLRPAGDDDVATLTHIRSEPEIMRWWGRFEPEELARDFVGAENCFVVEVAGEVVGGIQYEEETEPMYRHAGIDLFLAQSHQGKGLGPEALRLLARYLFEERGHHRLTIDPAVENAAAVKAYERVGFRRVGVMRQYELGLDGTWHDGLLMDMLHGELEG